MALAAASEAVRAAGLVDGEAVASDRFGIHLGSGEGQTDFDRFVEMVHASRDGHGVVSARFTRRGMAEFDALNEAEQEPGRPARPLAGIVIARGPNASCLTACAASAQAIDAAANLIRDGDADVMLAGGVHSMIHPLGLSGFIFLAAMSTRNDDPGRASRPFDRDRDRFVIGEAEGTVVLESLDHARACGAEILREVAGHSSTANAFRLTDRHDKRRGAIAAIQQALADARLNAEDG